MAGICSRMDWPSQGKILYWLILSLIMQVGIMLCESISQFMFSAKIKLFSGQTIFWMFRWFCEPAIIIIICFLYRNWNQPVSSFFIVSLCIGFGFRLFESRMKCIKKAELSRIHEFEIHNYYAEFLQFSEGQIAALHATNQLVKQHTKKTIKCL